MPASLGRLAGFGLNKATRLTALISSCRDSNILRLRRTFMGSQDQMQLLGSRNRNEQSPRLWILPQQTLSPRSTAEIASAGQTRSPGLIATRHCASDPCPEPYWVLAFPNCVRNRIERPQAAPITPSPPSTPPSLHAEPAMCVALCAGRWILPCTDIYIRIYMCVDAQTEA